ncbi:hypothetical protein M8818_005629 [Zalaria obscura]|uniref:Uncharacterized protein n=1 Tax=Zalaria obscura TaxID=2024903 RepID=A0ACC3S8K4_9PEZI
MSRYALDAKADPREFASSRGRAKRALAWQSEPPCLTPAKRQRVCGAAQLLILLSFMGEVSPSRPAAAHTTNELQTAAFNCFSNLFSSLSLTTAGKSSLTEAANVPSLGHAVMVILSGVTDGAAQGTALDGAYRMSEHLDEAPPVDHERRRSR